MPGRILSIALLSGLVVALLTLARPAFASVAPFSDDRGATAVAPPPALEAPDEAIIRARLTCDHPGPHSLHAAIVPPRSSAPPPSQGVEPTLPVSVAAARPAAGEAVDRRDLLETNGRLGVRSRVERPPRG